MVNHLFPLLRKEIQIEFRNKYLLGGVLLYVFSSILVVYFSLSYNNSLSEITPVIWSVLFWLIVLFSAINAIAGSFFREQEGRFYYYYYLTSPQAIILAKLIYNYFFTLVLGLLSFAFFSLVIGNPILNLSIFLIALILGGASYSFLFTLMGAIAARAGNNATLMAVLGFPIIIPLLIFITKLSAAAIHQEAFSTEVWKNCGLLFSFDVLLIILAMLLFPYIWRD